VVDGLHKLGHDIELIRPRQNGVEQVEGQGRFSEVLMKSLPIPKYPALRMGIPSKGTLLQRWSLHRPDVVHIATEGPLGWSALRAAIKLKLPITSDFRTNFHAYSKYYGAGWLNKPIMAYLKKFHNRAGSTMVPTHELKHQLEAQGFKRLHVVSRGVDTTRFNPNQRSTDLRAQWGLTDDDVLMACVGRLAVEKNLQLLLQAYEAVKAKMPRTRLLLVGDGPMREALQSSCPEAIFAGQKKGQALAAHYASADMFVFPSLTETFGNVTTEAMASGLPVVAFNYAAAAQLIQHDDNGCLAELDRAQDLIALSVALAMDKPKRMAMQHRALKTAQELDWRLIVRQFEANLTQTIAQSEAEIDALMLARSYSTS
jgi:glycosyltransferase involved in cell wall biosynthesis